MFWDNVCVHQRLVVRRGDGVFWDDLCVHYRLVVRKGERVCLGTMRVLTGDYMYIVGRKGVRDDMCVF